MAKILAIISTKRSDTTTMVRAALHEPDAHLVVSASTIKDAYRELEDGNFDAIVLADVLDDSDPRAFFNIIAGLSMRNRARTILFHVGHEDNATEFPLGGGFFASVHGRTEDDDENSLVRRLAQLVQGK
jgi:hypothetical protein